MHFFYLSFFVFIFCLWVLVFYLGLLSWSSLWVICLGLLSCSLLFLGLLSRSFVWVFCFFFWSESFVCVFCLGRWSGSCVWVLCLGLLSGTLVCVFCLGLVSWSFVLALVFVLYLASNKIFYVLLNPSSHTRHREKKPITRPFLKGSRRPENHLKTPNRK